MTTVTIGKAIRKAMDDQKWSVYKLSKMSGVQITPLQFILKGTKDYTIGSLLKICNALEIKIM